jgi:hypothetical protein
MLANGWLTAHLVVLALWGGLISAEVVMEFGGRVSERLSYATARMHYWTDLFIEIPLLTSVVVTGLILLMSTQADALLWVKVACGLGAVAANAVCVAVVFRRNRMALAGGGAVALRGLSRWVFRTAFVGVPLAIVAFWIGGYRVGWW